MYFGSKQMKALHACFSLNLRVTQGMQMRWMIKIMVPLPFYDPDETQRRSGCSKNAGGLHPHCWHAAGSGLKEVDAMLMHIIYFVYSPALTMRSLLLWSLMRCTSLRIVPAQIKLSVIILSSDVFSKPSTSIQNHEPLHY